MRRYIFCCIVVILLVAACIFVYKFKQFHADSKYAPAYCVTMPANKAWSQGFRDKSVAADCIITSAVRARSPEFCRLMLLFPVERGYTSEVGNRYFNECVAQVEKFKDVPRFDDDPVKEDYNAVFWNE